LTPAYGLQTQSGDRSPHMTSRRNGRI